MSLHPISSCSVRRSGIPARPAPRNARPWARPWALARRARHAAPLLLLAACADSGPLGGEDAAAPTAAIALCADPADSRASSLTAADIADFSVTACRSDRSSDGSSSWIDAPAAPWFFNTRVYDITRVSDKSSNATTYNARWTYDQVQYWPSSSNQAIRFFALAPYAAVATDKATKMLIKSGSDADPTAPAVLEVDYVVPKDVSEQHDLLYSTQPYEPINRAFYKADGTAHDYSITADPVAFTFGHAMARLSFKVQMGEEVTDTKYTAMIKSIKLYAFYKGTMTITPGDADDADAANNANAISWINESDYEAGVDVIRNHVVELTPSHGLPAANGSYTDGNTTVPTYNIAIAARTGGTDGGEDAAAPTAVKADYNYPVSLTGEGDYLFMMPQRPPTKGTDLSKPTQMVMPVLYIDYRLHNGLTGDDELYTDKSVSFSLTEIHLAQQGTSYEALTTDNEASWPWVWEAGKAYSYLLTISTTDVTLNIYPTNWIDGNNGYHDYIFY